VWKKNPKGREEENNGPFARGSLKKEQKVRGGV